MNADDSPQATLTAGRSKMAPATGFDDPGQSCGRVCDTVLVRRVAVGDSVQWGGVHASESGHPQL